MQLASTFSVVAPIDTVWKTLMEFDRVAGCVPGAEILEKISEDDYKVGMKVKLGPISMQYKGVMEVIERDAVAHRAVFKGRAQEARGQGTADGSATLALSEDAGVTTGTVNADISLSGKAAAMGKGVIMSVTDQMMALFAKNLQEMVTQPTSGGTDAAADAPADATPAPLEPVGTSVTTPAAATIASATTGVTTPSATAATAQQPAHSASVSAPASPSVPAAGTSLNAMSLARGIVMDQLQSPAKLGILLVVVALVGFVIGRVIPG